MEAEKDKKRLESLLEELKKAIDASQALKPFKDQLLLDISPEGLRLQIVDKENRPMFDVGSANLQSYTRQILHEISKIIAVVPNHISIAGHTDARAYASGADFGNWELSSDRANACRRELVRGGVGEEKIARVVGLASTALFDKSNPLSPINRRISIVVMNKETEEAMLEKEKVEKRISSGDAVTADTIESVPGMESIPGARVEKSVQPSASPTPTPTPTPTPAPTATPTPIKVIEPTPAPVKKVVPTATALPTKAAPAATGKSKPTATPTLPPSTSGTVKLPAIPSAIQLPGLPINTPTTGIVTPTKSNPPAGQNKTSP